MLLISAALSVSCRDEAGSSQRWAWQSGRQILSDKPWGGVFDQAMDQRVEKFTESVSFDRRLYAHDIRGSIAHANMLSKVGVLTDDERHQIVTGLEQIGEEIAAGRFQFRQELEDIHMNVERTLVERIGDTGRKLHTGRSRNDQISNDIRLWVRDEIDAMSNRLELVQRAFISRAEADAGVIVPAYTHLQRAQPVLAAHYWLAYCEKLERERERLADCRNRVNQMSLGSAALAGTSIPIDRHMVAEELEFDGILANSLDGSSARDFILEFAFCLASIATTLSGWAEEWILWSTTEFSFLRLPQKFCTGSSIMPQKINPDVLELVRGKTGRVVGNLMALFTILKGLPQAYNRDLQEDKERLFDSVDTVAACLDLAAPIVAGAELNRGAITARLDEGYLDATTLMEHLIMEGVPQRTAHEIIGRLVATAMKKGVPLAELPQDVFQSAHESLDASVYEVLGAKRAVEAFTSYGSTNPEQVQHQLTLWRERLSD
jgi:argininosuccinate lyase